MTKAYNDIDAVTRLLEEKEKDLELAAKIGQQLLERNKQVSSRPFPSFQIFWKDAPASDPEWRR